MDVEYINKKKELYDFLLYFINCEDEEEDISYHDLINCIESQGIKEDQDEIISFVNLISKIIKNHHTDQRFFKRIEKILINFKDDLIQLSNSDIFCYFKKCKRILIFLLRNEIIKLDEDVFKFIKNNVDKDGTKYLLYFYPEIKSIIDPNLDKFIVDALTSINPNILNDFEYKRLEGQNNGYLYQLIRDDNISEFDIYITRTNTSLNKKVEPSFFETNSYLIKNEPTLIEYAAFFGSIQVFNYLRLSGAKINGTLYYYAIHGNDPEIIHILEENRKPSTEFCFTCFREAIKCHHNDIANYFAEVYLNEKSFRINNKFNSYLDDVFHYCNFKYFPENACDSIIFYYLCRYNYVKLVEIYMKKDKLNVNFKILRKGKKKTEIINYYYYNIYIFFNQILIYFYL